MGGIRQPCLKVTDDRAKQARCEKAWPERPGRILADGREQPQSGPGRRRHMLKLPADLRTEGIWPVRGGKTNCLGGIRGGTKGVRAHMGNARGLSGGASGGRCCRSSHITSRTMSNESAADFPGDVKLATSEGPRPGDRLTRAGIARSFRLEQPEHALRAVCCPHRHNPPVGFAERLRRPHSLILPSASSPVSR
jgi:hypothetical protein